jgi:two-component system, OmpR family, response regulator
LPAPNRRDMNTMDARARRELAGPRTTKGSPGRPMQAFEQDRRPARCLLVDDDVEIRDSVADFLARFGLVAIVAADGRAMRRILSTEPIDLIVLDIMLPDESGLRLCQWARSTKPDVPIIMLTGHGDPASRVVGLEVGADDYLGKPFEPRELVARIHVLLRRARIDSPRAHFDDVVRFDGWQFDRVRRQLVSPTSVVIALSAAEFRLLSAFVERPVRLLTREQLLDLTRGPGAEVSDRSIDLAVSRLRQKLNPSGRAPHLIKTMRGEGYMFDAMIDP